MKRLTERFLHYAVLIAITAGAVWVMWKMSARSDDLAEQQRTSIRPLAASSVPRAPVEMTPVEVEMCEVLATYSGKIRAWETYRIGFEVPGRVLQLGENSDGEPLDDGDRVDEGQVLAVLDDRVFRARRGEAAAQLEQAGSDLKRAQQVRNSNRSALSESELQRRVTEESLARAQFEIAAKNFEDATLRSPADVTISRRIVNAGESVNAHQIVYELVENGDVLLVLHVPESEVRDLEARMRWVEQRAATDSPGDDPEDRVFRAHVQLEGVDVFGRPWPVLDGEVYRIAEVADAVTSLFEVEVRLSNEERLLRPGMVATARLVINRLPGYRTPSSAVIYRANRAHVFTAVAETANLEMLYWDLGPTTVYRAHRVDLQQWIDQPGSVIVPASSTELVNVIVRGQHRLADGQLVRPVNGKPSDPPEVRPLLSGDAAPINVATGAAP